MGQWNWKSEGLSNSDPTFTDSWETTRQFVRLCVESYSPTSLKKVELEAADNDMSYEDVQQEKEEGRKVEKKSEKRK